MMLTIPNLLTPDEVNFVISTLQSEDFVDGKTTAGWHARLVKHNSQLSREARYHQDLRDFIRAALKRTVLFQMAAQPKIVHSILFSRYQEGMSYGSHIDNALMGGEDFLRSDVSLTLFLSEPETYEGGELVIEGVEGEQVFKLEAGSAIIYPSSTLHRVNPVTQGTRLVVVAWVQSLIRDVSQREILFDLDIARRALFEKHGKTTEFDLISKSHANLLRRWAQV